MLGLLRKWELYQAGTSFLEKLRRRMPGLGRRWLKGKMRPGIGWFKGTGDLFKTVRHADTEMTVMKEEACCTHS